MKLLLSKLGLSVEHLKCLDEVFYENNTEYKRIEDDIFGSDDFKKAIENISRELYAGGKTSGNALLKLSRQMILGDIIEYIFTGRAYYYATKSEDNFKNFLKLILYCVNQVLLFDTITVDPSLRKLYIEKLEQKIPLAILYEKEGDSEIAEEIKNSTILIWQDEWTTQIDQFMDSLLPKTLGCPKELVVFSELIRIRNWIVLPLLLIQRVFDNIEPIAPPDFLIMNRNKDIYGIEVGYAKEGQSREFSIRSSIPTFAIDLKNHMHNRCPKCGHNILYCDPVIDKYSNGTLELSLTDMGSFKRYLCKDCPQFGDVDCKFSNYYGYVKGDNFYGKEIEKRKMHFHSACVKDDKYMYNRRERIIKDFHMDEFFAQIPELEGLENL